MIASFDWSQWRDDSNSTATTISTTSTTTGTYIINCDDSSWYLRMPIVEKADPKRRIPFYRRLFDQRFPEPKRATVPEPRRLKWSPSMGAFGLTGDYQFPLTPRSSGEPS